MRGVNHETKLYTGDSMNVIDRIVPGHWRAALIAVLLSCLLLAGTASATPITENTGLGWQTLISNNYANGTLTHNNTFLATDNYTYGVMNETLTGPWWNVSGTSMRTGNMFFGQLSPSREALYRFNVSIFRTDSNPTLQLIGGLWRVEIQRDATSLYAYLYYYAANGSYYEKHISFGNISTADVSLQSCSNGSIIFWKTATPATRISIDQYDARRTSTYPSIQNTQIRAAVAAPGTATNISINNFEQSVPKKQITVYANPKEFAWGDDGPMDWWAGRDWLVAHNWTGTLWVDPSYSFNASQWENMRDLVHNKGWEAGIHFTESFTSLSWSVFQTDVASEISTVSANFNGTPLGSWVALGNTGNTTHQAYIWTNYGILHRNNPFSVSASGAGVDAMISNTTTISSTNMNYWYPASQYCSFVTDYAHTINTPLIATTSIDYETDFVTVMSRYSACGIRTVPFSNWYYESNNTAANITDIYLDTTGSHFTMDTTGWNASTRIIDPFGERVWYSATPGMMVITEIDNGADATNLTIRNNATDPVIRQANASIVPSSGKVLINVKEWNLISKRWNESASDHAITTLHEIGDFPANTNITVKKNGAMYVNLTTNSTGWMNFTYSDGYSDVMFEAEADSVLLAQFTPAEVSIRWWPDGVLFTDTSTGSPTAWNWTYRVEGTGIETSFNLTQNAMFLPPSAGNYLIRLSASNSFGSNISTQQTWVNVSQISFSPNQTIAYQYPAPVTLTKTNTTIIDTVNWSFGDTYTSQAFSPVQHIYTVAGNYTAYMNATNSSYGFSNTSKTFELTTDDDTFLKSWDQYENATITDLKGVAWTNSGCTLSTTAPKFGTQSLQCTDGNNYIYSPSSSIWDSSAIAGEMEAWINITAYGAAGKPVIKRSSGTDGTTNGWGLYEYNTSGYFAYWYGNAATNHTTPFYLPLNTQTHLVLMRNTSQYWEVYKNGVKVNGGNYVGGLSLDTTNPFQIGASGPGTEVSFRLDEFRYTQGVPRFVSDFSVPYAAYRGSLTGFIDTSPNSTYRYKTNPDGIVGISNWTNEGTRNRTVQVQNISEANYLVGGGNFDPLHEQVRATRLNLTNYPDLVLESSSIDNVGGIVTYNVSRGGTNKITALFDNRTNFLDVEVLYYNYTETSDDFQYFAYGTLINGTASFPIHNFIATPITYLTWTIYPNFTASSVLVPAGTPITFTDTTYGAPAGWTNYQWTFGDGGTSTSRSPVYTYTLPGTYSVGLTTSLVANSSVTNSTTKTSYITITGSGTGTPVANFVASPTTTTANSTVTFTDTSTLSPTSWLWDFGDGTGSTLQNPGHAYVTNGLYTVNLTATNGYGPNTISKNNYINITSGVPGTSVNTQNITMKAAYSLSITVTDSTTGLAIPSTTITDTNNQSVITNALGVGTLTEPYSVVIGTLVAGGYTTQSWSIVVDNDTSVTYQMTPSASTSTNTVWYVPKTVEFHVVDNYGNYLIGANVTGHFNSSTTLPGGLSDLISFYGMNQDAANNAANGTLIMTGYTDSMGNIVFTMLSTLNYDIYITYGGVTNYYTIHPQSTNYELRFMGYLAPDTSLQTCVYANGHTYTSAASDYLGNFTMGFSYQDTCGLTTTIDYYVMLKNTNTLVYHYTKTPVTTGIYVLNYTVTNTRGNNYAWFENVTRSV
jgi:PKD repeat protein